MAEVQTSNKNIDYFGIVKKSFSICWRNKFLWVLGILSGGSFTSINFNSPYSFTGNNQKTPAKLPENLENSFGNFTTWVGQHQLLFGLIVASVVIIGLSFLVISVMARTGIVDAADKLSKGEKYSFRKAFTFGWHKFWRVLGLGFVLGLIFLAYIVTLAALGFLLWFVKPLFILFVIIAVLLTIFFSLIFGILNEYSLRYAVLKDNKIRMSIKNGLDLILKFKKETAFFWLVTLLISMVVGACFLVGVLFVVAILVLLGLLLFLLQPIIAIIYAVVAVIAFVVTIFLAVGFISSFISTYWTLAFQELSN